MYEPLLQVTIPDIFCSHIYAPNAEDMPHKRKIVVIAEAWNFSIAEANIAFIVDMLLNSSTVNLVALGDFDAETQFARIPVTESAAEVQEHVKEAMQHLRDGKIQVADYLRLAFPMVQLEGVNDAGLIERAQTGRNERLQALKRLYEIDQPFEDADTELLHELEHIERDYARRRAARAIAVAQPQQDLPALIRRMWQELLEIELPNTPGTSLGEQVYTALRDKVGYGIFIRAADLPQLLRQAIEQTEGALPDDTKLVLEDSTVPIPEALQAVCRQLGLEVGDTIGVTEMAALVESLQHLIEQSDIPTFYHVPDRPLPILALLRARLQQIKRTHCSAAMQRLDALIAQVDEKISFLPKLLRFAASYGVDVALYPNVEAIAHQFRADHLDLALGQRQKEWLSRFVQAQLVGSQPNPNGGLGALFRMEIRQSMHNYEHAAGLMNSKRPLYITSRRAIKRITQAALKAWEGNEQHRARVASVMFDLASIFGVDDRNYSSYRSYAAARGRPFSITAVTRELRDLKADLVAEMPLTEVDRDLHRIEGRLDDLELLAAEELTAEDADRILMGWPPPSACEILSSLETLGMRFSETAREQASLFDTECIPAALMFYESSHSEAQTMADQILRAMARHAADTAILICGGYHPQRVVQELEATQQAVCSIIVPQLTERSIRLAQKGISLEELRKAASEPIMDVSLVVWGKSLRRQMLERLAEERGVQPPPDEPEQEYGGADRSDVKEWIQHYSWITAADELLSRHEGQIWGGTLQECRVCHREAPALPAADSIFCGREDVPTIVVQCPMCAEQEGRYICSHCAGREAVALFPGHGRRDAQRVGGLIGRLVCNIHGETLISQPGMLSRKSAVASSSETIRRRIISRRLPGHAWYK